MTHKGGRAGFLGGSPKSTCPGMILDLLKDKPMKPREIVQNLAHEHSKRTVQLHMFKLYKSGTTERVVTTGNSIRQYVYRLKKKVG